MADKNGQIPIQTDRIVLRCEPEFKDLVSLASEKTDGGNVSRLVRRAIVRLLEEEQPALFSTEESGRAA